MMNLPLAVLLDVILVVARGRIRPLELLSVDLVHRRHEVPDAVCPIPIDLDQRVGNDVLCTDDCFRDPGEKLAETQPFPSKPAPYGMQGLTYDDLVDFTPAMREAAIEAINGVMIPTCAMIMAVGGKCRLKTPKGPERDSMR